MSEYQWRYEMKRLILGLMIAAVCAPAWADGFDLPPGKWWQNPHLVEQIGLTSQQQQQIRERVVKHARGMIDLTADLRRAEFDLKEAADAEPFDVAAVRSAFDRFQQARRALETDRFELVIAVRQLLSADQWHELSAMREEFRRRHGDRLRGERPMRPDGPLGERGPRADRGPDDNGMPPDMPDGG